MNDKCKYCDYVSKCSRNCEYDSIICRIKRSFSKVVDKSYEQLQQENKQLKIQISAREEVCNRLEDNWNKLNQKYLNAVADYEKTMFEKEQLKKQLEEKDKPQIFIDAQDIEERYAEGLYQDYLEEENKKHKTQQKKFVEYMNKTIEELECDDVDDEEMKGYLIQRIDIFKEILSKYEEIIGESDDKK